MTTVFVQVAGQDGLSVATSTRQAPLPPIIINQGLPGPPGPTGPSGSGGGWTPPGPVQEIDFFDGINPADTFLERMDHPIGWGSGGLLLTDPSGNGLGIRSGSGLGRFSALYSFGFDIYSEYDLDTGLYGNNATWMHMTAENGAAQVFLSDPDAPNTSFNGISILRTSTPNSSYGQLKSSRDTAAPAASGLGALQVFDQSVSASVPVLAADYDGSLHWSADTTLQRQAAGVLQIPQHGGGLMLTSPDGTKTAQLQLSNAGSLVLV